MAWKRARRVNGRWAYLSGPWTILQTGEQAWTVLHDGVVSGKFRTLGAAQQYTVTSA